VSAPRTYEEWYGKGVAAAIPWLAGGPHGQAEAGSWPRLLDDIVRDRLTQARYQAFPGLAAADALPFLGNDRKLIQGSSETEAAFRARLQNPWDQWARAGTWLGLLCQLYWYGLGNAIILQQNGRAASLTSTPVIGTDPTSLYSFVNTSTLANTLTSTLAPFRSIPAGTPWVTFDGNTDLSNRFVVVLPSWPFAALSVALFNNSDSAAVTWPVPFGSTSYSVIYGTPSDGVTLAVDGTTKTTSGLTLRASAPWTGAVWVIAWAAGVNPFNTFSAASLGALQSLIRSFRSNALCVGVYAYGTSKGAWGWPIRKWGNGDKWGATNVIKILGGF
jgi:hypothetical protein